jgi:dihydrolipoamide dehydrogenase
MQDYDIAVIGGGPGGYVAAIKAAQAGKKVCLIEKGRLGGVCLNQGCIPTKTLLKSVEVLNSVKQSAQYGITGIDPTKAAINMTKLKQRKDKVVTKLTGGVEYLLKANGIKVFTGNASLVDKNTISTENEQIRADNIIIATGSTPAKLPIPISSDAPVITSEEALDLDQLPEKIAVIGGGVIGIEFAYIFKNLGSEVTIIELLDRILPMVDEEIAEEVTKDLKKYGIKIATSAKVTRIEGKKVYYEKDGKEETSEADKILMSLGRVPSTEGLNIEAIGIKTERRAIAVDEHMQTNIPNIYAIGDVNGKQMLAHTASMEGIVAVENISGNKIKMDYTKIPQCIYLEPEIATVGLTEKQAREKYGNIKVGRFPLSANGKATVEGETKGIIKVIIEPKYNEILGVHIYGIHATDMIAEMVLAMKLESTAEEVTMAVHPHPTVSEIIPEAFHAALGKAIHFV